MTDARVLSCTTLETQLGPFLVVADEDSLCAATFVQPGSEQAARAVLGHRLGSVIVDDEHPVLHQTRRQLAAYFKGKRRAFTLPLELDGTPFQCRVWDALRHIPYGHTVSYGEIARRIGRPTASRAVAQACGANPLPLVIPCHRVVASDGSLGGFSAGLHRKRKLLALEGHQASGLPLFAVATRREDEADRQDLEQDVLAKLPTTLRENLASGAIPEGGEQERMLVEAISCLESADLPVLASTLAQIADKHSSRGAAAMTEELLAIVSARLLDAIPPLAELQCMLHAALVAGSPSYVQIGRRLACSVSLPPSHRTELEKTYRSIMSGERSVNRSIKEATVDLWLDLRRREGDDPWVADRCEAPHEVFADAGLLWEAVLAAENALAGGHTDRVRLLGQLADMYEQLGDESSARDRLLALLAEREDPQRLQQLRRLEDRMEDTR